MTENPEVKEPLWNSVAEAWDRWSPTIRAWFGPATKRLMDMVDLRPGQRVLDIATGNGDQAMDFAERVGSRGMVLATDLSEDVLRFAARNFRKRGFSNVSTRPMNAEQLDLPDQSFDVVMCRAGLPYFPDQERAVDEMFRVLKPGGAVGILGFTMPEKNDFFYLPISVILRHAKKPPMKAGDVGPFSLSIPGMLENLFERSGFDDIRVEDFNSPLRNRSSDAHLQLLKDSWPILHNMMSGFTQGQKEACWAEIGQALKRYDSSEGFALPSELMLGAAVKPTRKKIPMRAQNLRNSPSQISLVSPSGFRLEGLSIAEAIEVLRTLESG